MLDKTVALMSESWHQRDAAGKFGISLCQCSTWLKKRKHTDSFRQDGEKSSQVLYGVEFVAFEKQVVKEYTKRIPSGRSARRLTGRWDGPSSIRDPRGARLGVTGRAALRSATALVCSCKFIGSRSSPDFCHIVCTSTTNQDRIKPAEISKGNGEARFRHRSSSHLVRKYWRGTSRQDS